MVFAFIGPDIGGEGKLGERNEGGEVPAGQPLPPQLLLSGVSKEGEVEVFPSLGQALEEGEAQLLVFLLDHSSSFCLHCHTGFTKQKLEVT